MPSRVDSNPSGASGPIRLALLVWLAAAIAAGASGAVASLRPPLPQLVLLALTIALIVCGEVVPGLKAWRSAVDARALLAVHLTRFVGLYFVYLHGRGRLPYAFAVPGGWGDVAVATVAAALLLTGPPSTPGRRRGYLLWNLLGLVDIVLVAATAGRLAWLDPASMAELQRLPLSLLPTFLVPLILTTHVWLFLRLRSP